MSESGTLMQKAYRYLRSAEILWRDGDSSSAVSRVYYAMFFAAQAALLTQGDDTFFTQRCFVCVW